MNLEDEVIDYFLTMFPGFVIRTKNKETEDKEFTNQLENMSKEGITKLLKQLTNDFFNSFKIIDCKKYKKYLQLYRELQIVFRKQLIF